MLPKHRAKSNFRWMFWRNCQVLKTEVCCTLSTKISTIWILWLSIRLKKSTLLQTHCSICGVTPETTIAYLQSHHPIAQAVPRVYPSLLNTMQKHSHRREGQSWEVTTSCKSTVQPSCRQLCDPKRDMGRPKHHKWDCLLQPRLPYGRAAGLLYPIRPFPCPTMVSP